MNRKTVLIIVSIALLFAFLTACGESNGIGSYGISTTITSNDTDNKPDINPSSDVKTEPTPPPVVGASESLIKESVMGTVLIIDNEEWIIDEDSFISFTIDSQDTTESLDTIITTIELKDITLTAEGQMYIEFQNNSGWTLLEHRVQTHFTTSFLPHAVIDVSDNDLITVLSRSDIPFSASSLTEYDKLVNQATVDIASALLGIPFLSLLTGTDPTEQTFSFAPEDVTDFVILNSTVAEKGTIQTFYSYFVLHKELATIGVNAKVTYRFDSVSGWVLEDTAFASKIESVANLAGTRWVGTATETPLNQIMPQFILYITEFMDDGTMRATFDFPSEPHSGTLTGFYDSNRLSFSFSFDEWIDLPYWGNRPVRIGSGFERGYQINLDGYLFIEDAILRSPDRVGTTSKNGFNVTLDSWFDVTASDNNP